MKKILFVSLNDHVAWGGSEVLWSEAAKSLANTCSIAVLVKKWKNTPQPIVTLQNCGVEVFYKPTIKIKGFKQVFIEKIKHKLGFKKEEPINELEAVKNIEQFDLVIISVGNHVDPKIVEYTGFLNKINKPYVINVQLATDLRHIEDPSILKLKIAYEKAKGVCYLSQENFNSIEMLFGVKLLNTIKIDNPFNYGQNYVKPNATPQVFNVACVAALTSFHKGQDILITVLSQEKWKNRNIFLNLYGNGINENQLKSLIKRYKLENKVCLEGHEPDKNKIWIENVACIMPSRMEGQSLAMLEALSFGRVVISTKVGDAERLIKDNITGFLAQGATVELLDEALERAWGKRNEWAEIGALARMHLYTVVQKDPVIEFAEKLEKLVK